MSITIRTVRPEDYPALTDIYNSQNEPHHHLTEHELRESDRRANERVFYRRLIALVNGEVVGTGQFGERPSDNPPGKYWAWFFVRSDYQNKGVDTALWDEALSLLGEREPASLWTNVREDFVASAGYLRDRAYQEQFRSWGANLDLSKFDAGEFKHYTDRLSSHGIELHTYEELASDPRRDEKLVALQVEVEQDAPHFEPIIPKRNPTVKDRDTLLDSVIVAVRGNEYLGMASLLKPRRFSSVPGSGFTGVKASYRNLGVATALKALAATRAQRQGYSEVNAGGAGANNAILKVNQRLGFATEPAWITYAKFL